MICYKKNENYFEDIHIHLQWIKYVNILQISDITGNNKKNNIVINGRCVFLYLVLPCCSKDSLRRKSIQCTILTILDNKPKTRTIHNITNHFKSNSNTMQYITVYKLVREKIEISLEWAVLKSTNQQ